MSDPLHVLRCFLSAHLGARRDGGPIVDALAHRLERIARRAGASDRDALARAIARASPDDPLYALALDELTVGETWFFRDADALARELALLEKRSEPLRIWCAGCATGEEAHSLAYLVAKIAGDGEIVATDVHPARLLVARGRRYPRARARRAALPAGFADLEGDEVVVRPAARVPVRFVRHNLAVEGPPGETFDAIVCKNVFLYLDAPSRARALDTFARSLHPGGRVLFGTSDLMDSERRQNPLLEPVAGALPVLARRREKPGEPVAHVLEVPPRVEAPPRSGEPEPAQLVARAETRLAQGALDEAELLAIGALDRDPSLRAAVLLLARIAERRGDLTIAKLISGEGS